MGLPNDYVDYYKGFTGLRREERLGLPLKKRVPPGVAGVPIFGRTCDWLFRGGKPAEAGFDNLHKEGVRTIVSLRRYKDQTDKVAEQAACERLGIKLVNIEMSEDVAPTEEQISQFMKAVKNGKENGKVFVHCLAGMDRSGCMIGLYRVMEQGYSFEQAHQEMLSYGFHDNYTNLLDCVRQHATNKNASSGSNANKIVDPAGLKAAETNGDPAVIKPPTAWQDDED